MGTGSGPGRLNSRVFTNSYSSKSMAMVVPLGAREHGDSFAGLSRPQYSSITYRSIAYLGAGAGGRGGRWDVAHGIVQPFIPPATRRL